MIVLDERSYEKGFKFLVGHALYWVRKPSLILFPEKTG